MFELLLSCSQGEFQENSEGVSRVFSELFRNSFRKVPAVLGVWWPTSGESNRPLTPILLKSIAIHLPFLSRYFCQTHALLLAESRIYTTSLYRDPPPICIAILYRVLGSGVVGTLLIPVCCKSLCCASRFCTGGGAAAGSRSKQMSEEMCSKYQVGGLRVGA